MSLTCAIDASHYQGASINWAAVKAALAKLGPDPWAYVKASQGSSTVDAEFVRNFHAMLAAELNRGAYHYMDDSSPKTQAQHFAAVIVSGGFNVETDVAVLDLERSGFSQVITHEHAVEFVTELRALMPGIVVGIYLGMGYAGNGTGSGLSHAFDFWILAHYTHTTTWPTTFSPALEDGNTTGWAAPHVWQCSQSMHVSGISGAVDADVSLLGFHQLLALGEDMDLTQANLDAIAKAVASYNDPNISTHTFYGSAAGVRNALDVPTAGQGGVTGDLTAAAIGKAVVAALPPAATGGLTMEQVEQAVQAVFAQAAGITDGGHIEGHDPAKPTG